MEYLFGRTCCSRLDYVEPRLGGQLSNIRFNTSLKFCLPKCDPVSLGKHALLSCVHLVVSQQISSVLAAFGRLESKNMDGSGCVNRSQRALSATTLVEHTVEQPPMSNPTDCKASSVLFPNSRIWRKRGYLRYRFLLKWRSHSFSYPGCPIRRCQVAHQPCPGKVNRALKPQFWCSCVPVRTDGVGPCSVRLLEEKSIVPSPQYKSSLSTRFLAQPVITSVTTPSTY